MKIILGNRKIIKRKENTKMNKDKQIGTINETYDYWKFKKQKGNREITTKGLRILEISVEKNGWHPEPILVNEYFEVCDGQHRLEYAKKNHLPIPYIVRPGITPSMCIMINSRRKNWTSDDYVKHYAELGNESYQKILDLKSRFPNFTLSLIIRIIKSGGTSVYGTENKVLAEGKLKLEEDEYWNAFYKLQYINSIYEKIKKIKGSQFYLIRAICSIYDMEEVDKDRLATTISDWGKEFSPIANVISAIEQIEEYYNYKLRYKVPIVENYKKRLLKTKQENLIHNKKIK